MLLILVATLRRSVRTHTSLKPAGRGNRQKEKPDSVYGRKSMLLFLSQVRSCRASPETTQTLYPRDLLPSLGLRVEDVRATHKDFRSAV